MTPRLAHFAQRSDYLKEVVAAEAVELAAEHAATLEVWTELTDWLAAVA